MHKGGSHEDHLLVVAVDVISIQKSGYWWRGFDVVCTARLVGLGVGGRLMVRFSGKWFHIPRCEALKGI